MLSRAFLIIFICSICFQGYETTLIRLSQKDISRILKLHNKCRKRVMKVYRNFFNVKLPRAINMTNLRWNKNLASVTAKEMEKTTGQKYFNVTYNKVKAGQVHFYYRNYATFKKNTKFAINTKCKTYKNINSQQITNYPNKDTLMFEGFTQMVWKNTTDIGCALKKFAFDFLVCSYYPPGNVAGDAVFNTKHDN